MARRDDRVTLQRMLDSTDRALSLAESRSRRGLDEDWVAVLALMQLLQILGEGARRLSEPLRQQYREVPWSQIIGLRNRLIHGYDTVDLDRLWQVVSVDLPQLRVNLTRMLASLR
jgi:uncharacterized protein with HEPN domain